MDIYRKCEPWIYAMRPQTLIAGAAPVCLGSAMAYRDGHFRFFPAIICFLFAILCQIGANAINDWADFKKGADHQGRIGPDRMVGKGKISPKAMKKAVIFIFLAAFLCGATLLPEGGWPLLIIGLGSIGAAIAYSCGKYPLAWLGLGDALDIIFFGLFATIVPYYLQTQTIRLEIVWVALGIGLMINNVLLVNNTRDIHSDQIVGKKTLPVRFGRTFAFICYRFSSLIALLMTIILLIFNQFNPFILLPLMLYPWIWRLQLKFYSAQTAQDWAYVFQKTAQMILYYACLLMIGILLN